MHETYLNKHEMMNIPGRWLMLGLMGMALLSFKSYSVTPFDGVVQAIKAGNAAGLNKYFDNMVEITLQDHSNSYSKAQAEVILREFFARNSVRSFQLIHQGGAESKFGIGNLVTVNGTFRITFFMRQKGKTYVLQEIRFENA